MKKTANTNYPNLVAELARCNMSIAELAGVIGMSRNNLYNKMHGRTRFNIDDMQKVRKALIVNGYTGDSSLDHLFKEVSA